MPPVLHLHLPVHDISQLYFVRMKGGMLASSRNVRYGRQEQLTFFSLSRPTQAGLCSACLMVHKTNLTQCLV